MVGFDMIFTAVLVIGIGLLFIDLVPLQENMTCNNYENVSECPEAFFSMSYQAAREKFLTAAEAAKAEIGSHLILERSNVRYFIDTAFFPGKISDKLLVHASGTHGVEGYTGSAIQTKLLQEWNSTFQEGPSILFVHAINPYGMAHNRRFNENNVDLNRNYLTPEQWTHVKSRDANVAGYETLRPVLCPSGVPRFIDRYWWFYSTIKAVVMHGMSTLKRAIVTGQYHDPAGMYYGGDGEQKSVQVLREILKKYSARGLKDAIFVDVHTGLGPSGVDTIMVSNDQDEMRSKEIFAGMRVQNDHKAKDGPSGGYDLAMGIIRPKAELCPNALCVTEEFGTVNALFVARGMILENQANRFCRGSYVHEVYGLWLRDVFYPQSLAYKRSTLKRGTDAFWNCIKHLSM